MISLFGVKDAFDFQNTEIRRAVCDVLESGKYIGWEQVKKFELNMMEYLDVAYAVGVNSGTDALILSLKALGIGDGDAVITSPFTFKGAVQAIKYVGAQPVYADIDPYTYNICPKSIDKIYSEDIYDWGQIKAVIVTHIFGGPADMGAIKHLQTMYKFKIIEDCAQAFGAEYDGQKVGTFGDAGIFSFYPTKVLGAAGDAGMVVTNDAEIMNNVTMLSDHYDTENNYGRNSRLDAVQAAVLNVKLRHIDSLIGHRQAIARMYRDVIGGIVHHPIYTVETEEVYGLYTIRHPNRLGIIDEFRPNGIEYGIYYQLPLYYEYPEITTRRKPEEFCSVVEKISSQVISIPMHPFLTQNDIENVALCVERGVWNYRLED